MKNHKGFISIIVLMVMTLSFIMLLYILDINKLQSLTIIHSRDHDQSLYNSESKLLLCLNDEEYLQNKLNPVLFESFRSTNFASTRYITIDSSDLEDGDDMDELELKFKEIEDIKHMQLKSKSNVNGNVTHTQVIASLVNEIYEMQIPILDEKALEGNLGSSDLEEIKSLTKQIEDNIDIKTIYTSQTLHGFQSDDYERVSLMENKIICTRDSMAKPYTDFFDKRDVFIVCRKYNNEPIDFYIDKVHRDKRLFGIIYVEGDLYVNTDLKFDGIIIINGGKLIIEDDKQFNIEGMLIYINNEEKQSIPDNLKVSYWPRVIYKYGTYLPEFFDIRVKLIKSY